MTILTIKDITNLYLYKDRETPKDRLDDSLISKVISNPEEINKKEFMEGPGRFITASDFSIVSAFFNEKK